MNRPSIKQDANILYHAPELVYLGRLDLSNGVYFEIEGDQLWMDIHSVTTILTSAEFATVRKSFVNKLVNVDEFMNSKTCKRLWLTDELKRLVGERNE